MVRVCVGGGGHQKMKSSGINLNFLGKIITVTNDEKILGKFWENSEKILGNFTDKKMKSSEINQNFSGKFKTAQND